MLISVNFLFVNFRAFGFDEETAILAYIESQLIPPKDQIALSSDTEYQERIDEAISSLSSFAKLENKLKQAVTKVCKTKCYLFVNLNYNSKTSYCKETRG